jgi:hypothetical protein
MQHVTAYKNNSGQWISASSRTLDAPYFKLLEAPFQVLATAREIEMRERVSQRRGF